MADIRSIEGGKKKAESARELEVCECGCAWFSQQYLVDTPAVKIQTCFLCRSEYTVIQDDLCDA